MNWYCLLISEEARNVPPFYAKEHDLRGRNWGDLEQGMLIDGWDSNSFLRSVDAERDGVPDDILGNSMRLPVFSERLRLALSEAGVAQADIQYLPVHLMRSTGEEVGGFAIANVIARVPALERTKSFLCEVDDDEIDPLTGEPNVVCVGNAALKSAVLAGHDLVRLSEFFPPVFVSERFVDVFRRHGFTGASFTRSIVT